MNTFTTTLLIWRDTTRVGNFHLFWFVGFLFRRVLSVPFCYFPCFVATITAAFVLLKEGNQFTLTVLPQEKVLSLLTNTKKILLCNKIPNLTVIPNKYSKIFLDFFYEMFLKIILNSNHLE